MTDFICRKCGSREYKVIEKSNGTGTATGLYCAKCGLWHKWLNKQEKVICDNQPTQEVQQLQSEILALKKQLEGTIKLPCINKINYGKMIMYQVVYKDRYGAILDCMFKEIDLPKAKQVLKKLQEDPKQ